MPLNVKTNGPNKEEQESLERYFGFGHAKINILGDLDPKRITDNQNKSFDMNMSKKELERAIKDFVNIYGYIYANGENTEKTLVRGTGKEEIQNLFSKDYEYTNPVSTTDSVSIAKTFREYGNDKLVKINTNSVPYLNAEQFKDKDSRDESEYLILPFTKVEETSIEFDSVEISLKKEKLPQIDGEKLEKASEIIISQYEDFMANIKEIKKLEEKEQWIKSRFERNKSTYSQEDIEYDRQEIKNTREEIEKIKIGVDKYRNNFKTMLKGLCAQREKIKDKEKAENLKNEINELNENVTDSTKRLNTTVNYHSNDFINVIKKNKEIKELLGLKPNLALDENQLENMTKQITNELSNKLPTFKNVEEAKKIMSEKSMKYEQLSDSFYDTPRDIDNLKKALFDETKQELNEKIKQIMIDATNQKYQKEIENLTNNKSNSFFAKLTGKVKLQEEQIKNTELKRQLEILKLTNSNPENSVKNMLQGMYECAIKNNGGKLTPEMQKNEMLIRNCFGNLPPRETLIQKAMETQNNNLPALANQNKTREGLLGFRKTNQLQNENLSLQEQITNENQTRKNGQNNFNNIRIDEEHNPTYIYSKYRNKLIKVHENVSDKNIENTINQNIEQTR